MAKHVVVIDLVGAVPQHFDEPCAFPELGRVFRTGGFHPLEPVFPAVTCPVQVSLVTGARPLQHGIIGNGLFDRRTRTVTMWTWAASRMERPPIWEALGKRARGARTAVFFLQGPKGRTADIFLDPEPKHTPDGKTVPWCASGPRGLYEELAAKLGHFPLHRYWGPMAGIGSSEWILGAALDALARFRPELSFVYVPHLDYVGQRSGPGSAEFAAEAKRIDALVAEFIEGLGRAFRPSRPAVVLVSEYAFVPVSRAVMPNVALRDAGLLKVVEDSGAELPDMAASAAFAVVDHQVAHVYVEGGRADEAAAVLGSLAGVGEVCRGERLRELGAAHPNSGELVLLAAPDAWFGYYWWRDPGRAPGFARTVDIHRKPGYDPVELFFEPETRSIPLKAELVRGSHGLPPRSAADCGVLASTEPLVAARAARKVEAVAAMLLGVLASGGA